MSLEQHSHGLIYYFNISDFFLYYFTYINITVQLYRHAITWTTKKIITHLNKLYFVRQTFKKNYLNIYQTEENQF